MIASFLVACDETVTATDQADGTTAADTLYIRGGKDTVYVNRKDTVYHKDTVLVDRRDTVVHKDTVFVNRKDTVYVSPRDTAGADSGADTAALETGTDFHGKGFFLKGSKISYYTIEDNSSLSVSGKVYLDEITRDDGQIKVDSRYKISQYEKIVVDGFFYNVVTGKPSDAPISLELLANVLLYGMLNVNVLTHLEMARVSYLVRTEKRSVREAKAQAVLDILNQFHIDSTLKDDAVTVYMLDSSEPGAMLLALTVLFLGDRNEAEFKELLTDFSNDIASDGVWNDLEKKKEIAEWAKNADLSGRLEQIQERIAKDPEDSRPDFAKYIRSFWKAECSE